MFQKRIILVFFIILFLIGGAFPAFAAKDYNIKNDTESFFFIDGTTGNVGVGTTVPVGQLDIQAGSTTTSKITNINATFSDLATSKTGLYIDVNASVAGNRGITGSWSEVRTTADAGTYLNAVAGVYGEVLHSGSATADFMMGSVALVNQMGSGDITNAYGFYPQIWKGAGTISNAYGMYYQGVPNLNGDTGTDLGGDVTNQYGIGIRKLTEATTRNIGILIDDTTEGAATAGNFGIYEEAGYPSYFTGSIGIGTTAPEAKLSMHSSGPTLVDSHVNDDNTGANKIESHYAVGTAGSTRATPSDVQNFRFFFGGFDQEVGRISMNTPSMVGATAIGAMDIYTQGAAGTLVRRMTLDEHKAMFAINVGIGTTAPVALLQVGVDPAIPAGSSPVAAIKGNLVVDGKVYGDGSYLVNVTAANPTVNNVPKSAGTFLVDSAIYEVGGNVGIGTSVPVNKLDVISVGGNVGIGGSVSTVTIDSSNGGVSNAALKVVFNGASTDMGEASLLAHRNNAWSTLYINGSGTSLNNAIYVEGDKPVVFNGGNVGIGTTVPLRPLDVNGTGLIRGVANGTGGLFVDSNGQLVIGSQTTGDGQQITLRRGAIANPNGMQFCSPVYDARLYQAPNSDDLRIWTQVSGDVWSVTQAGNAGIGTITPASKLDVVGGAARILSNAGTANVGYATTPGSLYVQETLEVDGNVYFGDATTDNLTVTGTFNMTGGANYTGPVTISTTHAGAFVVRQQSNGTQIFNVDTQNGNVGIGTTAPLAMLSVGSGAPNLLPGSGSDLYVKGDIEFDGAIYGDGSQLGNIAKLISGLTPTRVPVASTSTTLVDSVIYSVGNNVGIGTAVPAAKFEVAGVIAGRGVANGGATFIQLQGAAGRGVYVGYDSVNDGAFLRAEDTGAVWKNLFIVAQDINIGGGDNDRSSVYIANTSGNVGIGTTAPAAKLDVVGGAAHILSNPAAANIGYATTPGSLYVQNDLEVDGNVYLGDATADNLTVTGTFNMTGGANYTGPVTISTTHAGALVVRQQSNGTQIFNVDTQNGNVGVGSVAPGQRLDVVGNIRASQVIDSGLTAGRITYAGTAGQLTDNANLVFDGANVGIGTTTSERALTILRNGEGDGAGQLRLATSFGYWELGRDQGVGSFIINNGNNNRFVIDNNAGNVGIGTTVPVARVHIGGAGTVPGMPITGNDLYVKGNIEFDGAIYGDGSQLGNIAKLISGLTPTRVPVASSSTTLVDSMIYSVGNNVGIGTTTPAQQLEITQNLRMPSTTNAAKYGIIYKGTTPFIHDFNYGNNGTATTNGYNTFVGLNAGNLTMGSTATSAIDASYNTAVGYYSLSATTIGESNTAIGYMALGTMTTGWDNVAIGVDAGRWIADGATANQTSTMSSYLGYGARASVDGASNETAVGFEAIGSGSNSVTLGNNSVVKTILKGNVGIGTTSPGALLELKTLTGVFPKMRFSADDVTLPNYSGSSSIADVSGSHVIGQIRNRLTGLGVQTGGLLIQGFTGGGVNNFFPLHLIGTHGGNSPTTAAVTIGGQKWNGVNNRDALTGAEIVLDVENNYSVGTTSPLLRILGSGNIGIGTIAPVAILHVGAGAPNVMPVADGNDVYIAGHLEVDGRIYGDGSALSGVATVNPTANNVPKSNGTAFIDSMIYSVGSNVGIGTAAPAYPLQIGPSGVTGNVAWSGTGVGNPWFGIYESGANLYYGIAEQLPAPAGTSVLGGYFGGLAVGGSTNGGTNPIFGVLTSTQSSSGIGNTAFTILDGNQVYTFNNTLDNGSGAANFKGNVGIGTTAPVAILHVGGAGSVPNAMPVADGNDVYIAGNLEVDGKIYGDGSALTSITGAVSGLTATRVPVASASTTLVDSNIYNVSGNVGIGSSIPRSTLDVNGTVNATGQIRAGGGISLQGEFNTNGGEVRMGDTGNLRLGSGQPLSWSSTADANGVKDIALRRNAAGVFQIYDGVTTTTYADLLLKNLIASGNVGIGTANPPAALAVGVGAPNAMSNTGSDAYIKGNLEVDGRIYGDAGGLTNIPGAIAGLTDNYIVRANGTSAIENSIIYDTGTNIGIGTTAPTGKLEVVGVGTGTAAALLLRNSSGAIQFRAQDNGSVAIGTSAAPAYPLDVRGTIRANEGDLISQRSGTYANLLVNSFNDTNWQGSRVGFNRTRGTAGAYTSVVSGDVIGWFDYFGYDGTTDQRVAQFTVNVDGPVSSGVIPGRFSIITADLSGVTRYRLMASANDDIAMAMSSGNVAIGSTVPYAKLYVGGGATQPNAMSITGNDLFVKGNIEFDGRIYGDAGGLSNIPGAITGLTDNYIVRANGTSAIENSIIYDEGTRIGIGTTVPQGRLDVVGIGVSSATASLTLRASDGTRRVTVLDNGNMGIGSAGPEARLVVFGSTDQHNLLVKDGGFRTFSVYLSSAPDAVGLGTRTTHPLYFFTNNNVSQASLLISTGGNIGIGTTVPNAKLAVVGTGTTTALAFEIDDNLYNPKVVVLDNGNVGIGTTQPVTTMDIRGGSLTPQLVVGSITASGSMSFRRSGDGVAVAGYGFPTAGEGSEIRASNSSGGSYFTWYVNSATSYRERLRLDPFGNLGIGTTAPNARLAIVGGGTTTGRAFEVDDNLYNPKFIVLDNGNVGIGTVSPRNKLEIAGSFIMGPNPSDGNWSDIWAGGVTPGGTNYNFELKNDGTEVTFNVPTGGVMAWTTNNGWTNSALFIANNKVGAAMSSATTPTAKIHIGAGSAAAGNAPLKLTSGTLLTAPEDGTLEYLSNQFYIRGSDGLSVAGNVGIGTTVPISTLEVAAAGTLAIPRGTAPTVSKAGHIAVDTTADQLLYYGTGERVLAYEQTRCGYFADLLSTDDQISMGAFAQPVTITGVGCTYNGAGTTLATFTLENGAGTAMTITGTNPTCTANNTAFTFAAVTASNALTAGQILRFNVTNTPAPSTDDYTICVRYVYTRQ